LGHMYAQGLGVQKDYYEAEKWTKKSADQGNDQAKKNLKTIKDLIKMSR